MGDGGLKAVGKEFFLFRSDVVLPSLLNAFRLWLESLLTELKVSFGAKVAAVPFPRSSIVGPRWGSGDIRTEPSF